MNEFLRLVKRYSKSSHNSIKNKNVWLLGKNVNYTAGENIRKLNHCLLPRTVYMRHQRENALMG